MTADSTRDGSRQYTQRSQYYGQPSVQAPSHFDGFLYEVPRPSQPLSYAQPVHPSVDSLPVYYSHSYGSSHTQLSYTFSSSSASSNSHPHYHSPSPSSEGQVSPSLLSHGYTSASDLGTYDLSESISTLRPESPFHEDLYSAQHLTQELFSCDETGTEAPIYQLQVFDVASESRTETQIRPRLAFIETSQSTMTDSISSIVVTEAEIKQWKHIRVPPSPKTKPTHLKPVPSSVLHLTARISCTKEPSVPIPCCPSCQARETRKSQKILSKLLNESVCASVLRGGSTIADGADQSPPYVSPLEFNGDGLIPLTNGTVDLSFRITCYCRHHGESSGFRVLFTLSDYCGRVVGEVMTSPIMIIDNHKSKPKLPRSPFRRSIRAPDNANGMLKSPAPKPTLLSDASRRPRCADGLPLIPQSTPTHHSGPTSISWNDYFGSNTSNNFQVTHPQGQTIGSYPRITRDIPDSGPMHGGTRISINDEDFFSIPQSTSAIGFGDHVTHYTVDRASVPGTIISNHKPWEGCF